MPRYRRSSQDCAGVARAQRGQPADGPDQAALPLAEDAAEIYRSLADRRGEAEALDQIGMAHQRAARSREALAYFQEARILYHDTTDQRGVANTLSHSGIRLLASWALSRCHGPSP